MTGKIPSRATVTGRPKPAKVGKSPKKTPTPKPRAVQLSKRANVFYLEHARVLQKDERVLYLTDSGEPVERFFNIPEKNTALLLLGKGTSITDSAARRLAESNVMVGFCGSGGSPLFSSIDAAFLCPQSEYRPTEYMQAWMRLWLDDERRLAAGKQLLRKRIELTLEAWSKDAELIQRKILLPDALIREFDRGIAKATSAQELLLAEARWAQKLYALLARGFDLGGFKREEGKGSRDDKADAVNSLIDHGNYIAYGFAAVALNGLGISFSLPLLHGKTRRGALVFDLADLVKDALVLPWAFGCGKAGYHTQEFREGLIEQCQQRLVLDVLFDFVQDLCKKT